MRRLALISAGLIGCAAAAAAGPAAPAKEEPHYGRQKFRSIFPASVPDEVLAPLKAEEGTWDADVELYVGDPAKQPIRKRAVQHNRFISAGNAMLNEFRYTDGSYSGTGMWAWDAFTNRYSGVWTDSDTHLVRHDIGYYDPTTQILRWEADTVQPDGVTTRLRMIEQFKGPVRTFQIDLMEPQTGRFKKLIFMTFTKRERSEQP